MLNCRACLWRCIQALDTTSPIRRDAASSPLSRPQRHFLRTSTRSIRKVGAKPTYLSEVEKVFKAKQEPWQKSTLAASIKEKERKALTRQPALTRSARPVAVNAPKRIGQRDPSVSVKDWNKRRKELQYLSDPLELANFVKKELSKDKAEEMVQLVRMASHSIQAIVSWNHIIDYYLAKGQVTPALKIYNDMKKRAQFPDSYTYTILLRGLSINAHQSGALAKALSVYHSMSAPNSRVEPSIIHTNAVLKVCARALDMDALWGVAAKIPEKGPASANAITYVTILNAIRQSLLVNVPRGETDEDVAIRRERGIMEGRRIWEDIIIKWRNADIVIEEELVCAMGRLLLIGARPRDWDDVLSLVEQTMDIPRFVPRLGSPARTEAGLPHLRAPNVPEQFRFDDDHLIPSRGPARGDEFLPIAAHGVGGALSSPLTYATPSNNTLSMVQEACLKVVANKAAQEYWDLLTDPTTYNVAPDVNNLNFRLRLLRQTRSSASAVKLLTEGFAASNLEPRPGTFRIAMSTCVRDKNNHKSLKHAGQILDLMMKMLEDADPKAVTMFAELAISFPLAKGSDLVEALARLDPVVRNIRLQLGVGAGYRLGTFTLQGAEREDAISALRRVSGVFDKLVNSDLISEEQKRPYKAEKARLTSYLHRIAFKDGQSGGGSRKWEAAEEEKDLETEAEAKGLKSKEEHKGDGSEEFRRENGRFWKRQSFRKGTRGVPTDNRTSWFSPRAGDALR